MKHNKTYLGILLLILISEAVFTGLLPITRGHLFTLLTQKVANGIWLACGMYFLNYFTIDFMQAMKGYVVLQVSLWYRTIRTKLIVNNLDSDNLPSNTPQRIQEDIKLSYVSRITVWCEYGISAAILVQLFLLNLDTPILIFSALTYAVISVFIALRFNPRLTLAEVESQQAEATYRTNLVDSIFNIAYLPNANAANLLAAKIRTQYLLFTKLQLGAVAVLPYIILIPNLLSGKLISVP